MKASRYSVTAALAVAIMLTFVSGAMAGEDVEALKAREAALMKELQAVRGQLDATGVAATPEVAATAEKEMTPQDDGHSLLYSGTVELGAAWAWAECLEDGIECGSELDDNSYPYVIGSGRANVPLADYWSLQADVDGWNTFTARGDEDEGGTEGEDNLQTFFSGALHGTWRDPSSGAAGIFGQFGSANGGDDENATFWLVGGEGQIYLGDVTLYGQGGYFEADDEDEDDVITNAFFLRGVGRWFLNPRTRIQGEFSWVDGNENAGPGDGPADDIFGYSWGVRADRSITDHPISLFLAYEGIYMNRQDLPLPDVLQEFTEHRIVAGVTFHFGVDNLMTQDRRGVTLDTPDVGRWVGSTIRIVD